MNDEIIIVTAAGAGTWMRERLTPSGLVRMLGEATISDYQEKMETLRSIDDEIYNWSKDLSMYVDAMEQAYKARRIMDFIRIVVKIDELLKNVSSKKEEVREISEKAWREFEKEKSFEDYDSELTDEYLSKHLQKLFPQKKSTEIYELAKQAGFFSDLKRKWVYEKLRSQKQKQRDAALISFFNSTKNIVKQVQKIIEELHKNRASGQIGKYLDLLRNIEKLQKTFEKNFKEIYNKYLKELIEEYSKKEEPEEEAEITSDQPVAPEPKPEPTPTPESTATPSAATAEIAAPVVPTPVTEPASTAPESAMPLELDTAKINIQNEIDSLKKYIEVLRKEKASNKEQGPSDDFIAEQELELQKLEQKLSTASHINFITKLASCSNQYEAAQLLLKYSEKIEDQDLESSLKLLAIAEGLLDD